MNEYQEYLALKNNADILLAKAHIAEAIARKRADEINNSFCTRRFECIGGFSSDVAYIVVKDGETIAEMKDGRQSHGYGDFTLLTCLNYVHRGMWREVT
jgi:hypothetical protein